MVCRELKNNRSDPFSYRGRVARLRLAPDGANEAHLSGVLNLQTRAEPEACGRMSPVGHKADITIALTNVRFAR